MSNNIDILSLHNKLLKMYDEYKKNVNKYKQELEILNKLINDNLPDTTKKKLNKQINSLKDFIDDIENERSKNYYIMETSNIIDQYTININKPITINFMNNKVSSNNQYNQKIIQDYINIYNNYNTKVLYNNNIKQCINCNTESFDNLDNHIICKNCGLSLNILIQNSSFKDSERINIIPKYTYNRKTHFKDCINQFQGKQQVNIKQKVYDDLTTQFELNHLLIGNEDTPKEERYKNITKKHIHLFLKETKHSKHYEDINLIYHNITGKKTNDISHLERKLIQDFDLLTQTYDRVFKNNQTVERKSFINSQYVLYQLLIRHKYRCNKEDFNILKTTDRQTFHDDVCKELFKQLGWNFKCLF
tara:strand:+ start:950 stop:2032 length:1083 start_codon:yes stop_codon:yes gene_type:complete